MECIKGKLRFELDRTTLETLLATYHHVLIDIGTGDGRFVRSVSRDNSHLFAIGVDACRENLGHESRRGAYNSLFVIANAERLPRELDSMVDRISVNFPWGSLLQGLLHAGSDVWEGISTISKASSVVNIILNAAATAEVGSTIDKALISLNSVAIRHGFRTQSVSMMGPQDLNQFPSSWAKRLAYGKMPVASCIELARIVPTG